MKKNTIKIATFIALLFIYSVSLFSQSTIRVTVKSGPAGNPVYQAGITLGGDLIGLTDAAGKFSSSVITGQTNDLAAWLNINTHISKSLTFAAGDNWMNFWFDPPTLPSDFDGNYYKTVTIGSQVWMAENLKVTHFSDGTIIPNVLGDVEWKALLTPGYCWYDNDISSRDINGVLNKDVYGALYNWYAVNTGKLCPTGWHVPSNDEWDNLVLTLDPDAQTGYNGVASGIAGGKLKEAGTDHWDNGNLATNESGFTALPGGYRATYGTGVRCSWMGFWGEWYTSTERNGGFGGSRNMRSSTTNLYTDNSNLPKWFGNSVRCIQNVQISGTTTVCQNAEQPYITFTVYSGTAPYTITYNINGGNNQTINITSGNSALVSVPTSTEGTFIYSLVRIQDAYSTDAQTGSATVTINPSPTTNAGPDQTICAGSIATLVGSIGGAASSAIWSGGTGTFTPNTSTLNATYTPSIEEVAAKTVTLTLTTNDPIGPCGTVSDQIVISINPVPIIAKKTVTICSGTAFTVTPANPDIVPQGTTYTWDIPVVTGGIQGGQSGDGASITGTLSNPTNTAQTATYTITPISGACQGTPFKLIVTVNPVATTNPAILSICDNIPLNYTASSSTPEATFSWSRAAVTGISNPAGTGTSPFINESLDNTTLGPVKVKYIIIPSSEGCAGTPYDLEVTVWPTSEVNQPSNQVVCNGSTTVGINFSSQNTGGEVTYTWKNNQPSIGLPADGVGNVASFTAINTGTAPVVASIEVTPYFSYGQCDGAIKKTFTITVNPTAKITSPTTARVCDNVALNYQTTSSTEGASFEWTRAAVTGISNTAGTGTSPLISESLDNTTTVPVVVTYIITPSYNGCTGTPFNLNVTVNPTPIAVTSVTNVKCNGDKTGAIDLTMTAGTPNYTYQWNNGASSEDLTNISAGSYYVTVTDANGCGGETGATVTEPSVLSISSTIANVSCNQCKDAKIELTTSGGKPGYTYAWTGPNGYISTTQNISKLKPAAYGVTVKDANQCSKTFYFEVINPFVVTSTSDENVNGTLRHAINAANGSNTVSRDTITFNLQGSGPFTIQPGTFLPVISNPVIIDGYSQPNASLENSILLIDLDGSNPGLSSNGLTVNANNCIIKGLIIHDFSDNGIRITSGTGNRISANSIYENGLRGIDLKKLNEDSGTVTLNDDGDTDSGPNNLQNFPVLSSLSFSQGSVTVSGTLNTIAATKSYTLEFFANKVADKYDIGGVAYGEGQTYIGSTAVTTDKKGTASFTAALTTFAKYGDIITATATDPDGNTSEFSATIGGLQNQILASNKIPFQYKMNGSDIVKTNYTIPYTTIKSEIDKSFLNWTGVNTSMMTFSDLGKTTSRYASATDNTNLVSFTDDQFPFSPGVLGVSAKTLKIVPNSTDAQIVDADIVINPYYLNHPTWDLGIADNASYPGFFDIQSIVTHEIGHVMGLIHSGVYNSVMWFEIGPGTNYQDFRTLKQDDKSWLSYRYPTAGYNSTYGSISGNIKYGENNEPVAGAIVLAIDPVTNLPKVHAYSDAAGNYLIPGLLPGNYNLYITPLDGSVYGRPLRPGNISSYIYCNTIYTDYPGEYYNASDGAEDPISTDPTPIQVLAGQESKNIDFVTNLDKTPPTVISVVPADDPPKLANASVSTTIVITFSEPVDISTITDQSCYLETGGTKISGNYQPKLFENNSDIVQLTLPNSLGFNTEYTLHLKPEIMDLKGNPLNVDDPLTTDVIETEYKITFTTVAADIISPTIKGIIPKDVATGVFLSDKIMVYFSEPMIRSTIENSFSLTTDNGTAKIDCSASWDEYSTFTLTPKSPLKEAKKYTLAWTDAGTDLYKNKLVSYVPDPAHPGDNVIPVPGSISFNTIPSAAPTVIYLEPGGSLTSNVNVLTCIVADFSEPINTSTINSTSTFILHEGTQTGPKVAGTFEFLKENSRVIFRPNTVLKYSQTYTVELTAGIADVSSTVGHLALLTAQFTTASKPAAPHISYLDPYAGKAGSYVTIAGNGFDPNPVNNIVRFNNISTGVQAKVTDASLTNLTVIVPSGAISGPVTVTVNGTPDDQAPSNYVTYFYMVPPSDPLEAAATPNVNSGNQSRDGVMDFNGARAFITNPGDNTVTVIENLDSENPSTNVAPIQVGTTPMKIAINPEGTLIYVTNHNSDNVSVIDITAGTDQYHVIRTINVGSHPLGIVASSDGKVYVANDQTISVINVDPTSGGFDHAVANINTGTTNRDADITVDGAILVVTGDNGLNIIKISQTGLGYDYGVYNVNPGTPTRDVSIPADAGTAIVTTIAGNIFLVDIVPGSENFGTAYANTNPPAKAGDGQTSFDGLYYWVTNPYDDKVTIYELFYGGGSSNPDPSNPSGLSLREYSFIDVGHRPEGICIENDNDKVLTINSGEEIGKGSVTKIVNRAIETKTIIDLVKDLAISLQTLIREKAIQQSLGNMLIVKVNDASKNITLKKTKTAINMLNAFIDKVNELDAAGKISNAYLNQHPDAVDYLIETAKVIICMLQSKDPTSCVSSAASTKSDSEESIINNVDLIPESKLGEIYPNPFSETITVSYEIADCSGNAEKVNISVYDVSGRLVSTLVNETMHSGHYTAVWKGKNNNGNQAAPYGTYFVRFKADNIEQVKQIMLIR